MLLDAKSLQEARAAKRAGDLVRQEASRTYHKGWRIQIAIGSTGGARNVGVEAWKTGEKEHYFSKPSDAMAWIDKQPKNSVDEANPPAREGT